MDKQEITEIIEYYCELYDLPYIEVWYKDYESSSIGVFQVRRYGILSTKPDTFWLKFNRLKFQDSNISSELKYAWVLHEIAHFIQHCHYHESNHNQTFKQIETQLLLDFGMVPVGYKRAYWTTVKSALSNRNFGQKNLE